MYVQSVGINVFHQDWKVLELCLTVFLESYWLFQWSLRDRTEVTNRYPMFPACVIMSGRYPTFVGSTWSATTSLIGMMPERYRPRCPHLPPGGNISFAWTDLTCWATSNEPWEINSPKDIRIESKPSSKPDSKTNCQDPSLWLWITGLNLVFQEQSIVSKSSKEPKI